MNEWTLSRRETLKGIGVATLGLAGASTARGQEANEILVTIEPRQVVLAPGETATVDIVVEGADSGVAAFTNVRLELEDTVASIESYSLTKGTPLDSSRIRNDGQTLELGAALLENTHASAPEIVIAQATVRADGPGQTTAAVSGGNLVGNNDTTYTPTSESGSIVVESETAPSATLDWSPSPVEATETVTFDASASTGAIVEYRWDFDGDGTVDATTPLPTVEHVYPDPGDRTVAVEVEDTSGRTARTEETITVEESRPELNARLDLSTDRPEVGEQITLDASDSTGLIAEYRWDFVGNGNFQETTTEPTTTHTYEEPGEQAVILQITDGEGETDETLIPVAVQSAAKTLSATFDWLPEQPEVGDTVSFDASASTGDIVEYRWDFGAGGEGFFDERTANSATTHTYEEPGEKTVILQVEDSAGQTTRAEDSVVVEQSDGGLSAAFDWTPGEPDVNEQARFDAGGSTGDIVEYRWDFTGDGTTDATTASPSTTHSYGESGTQTAVLEIEDSNGETDQAVGQIAVGGDENGGTDLSGALDWTPTAPDTGEEVRFDASGSTGSIAEYRWDFAAGGEGFFDETTTEPTVNHSYTESGTKTVVLEVTDGNGRTDRTEGTLVVDDAGEQLAATLEWTPTAPTVGEEVRFDATGSTGNVDEYRWDFDGDGTFEATTATSTRGHTYDESGETAVVLEVTDGDGQTARTEATIGVESTGTALSAAFGTPQQGESGQPVEFDASASTGSVAEYRWDFDSDGNIEESTDGPTASVTYQGSGTRLVTLTVVGEDGQTASAEATVDIEGGGGTGPGDDDDDSDGGGDGDGNATDRGNDGGDDDGDADGGSDGGGGNTDDSNESNSDGNSSDGDGGDGFGPGFGVGSALAGLGGAGYLLKRRLLDETEQK